MKKIIYIIAGIFIVASVVLTVIYKNKTIPSRNSQPSAASNPVPTLPSASELKEQGKIAISTSQGTTIINDPYKESSKVISGNAEIKDTDYYDIVYLGDLKSFVITIYGDNLNDSRAKAEQAFLESLGISENDACKLNTTLAVAPESNEAAAGKSYGLSFCSNGKPLPTN